MPATNPVSNPEELSPERLGQVRDHLKEVFASRAFAGSKRAQDFLQLIVEHALAGRLDSLRERMIGAEMFGRKIDYDTANDAVVRVKATEVRRKLAQYYQESTKPPLVRIELPGSPSVLPRVRKIIPLPISPADMINYCVYAGLTYSVGSQICVMKGSPPLYCDQPAGPAQPAGVPRPRASWTTSQPPATLNCTNDLVTGGPARPIR